MSNTQPGQTPAVTFSITDPTRGNVAYDIRTDPAFTNSAVSRLNVLIGWDTVDVHNTGSGSEFASPPAAGQPISVNALSGAVSNGNGTYTVQFTKPIATTAAGSGIAVLECRAAAQDITGAYSIQVPVKMAVQYFAITGTSVAPRRQAVDRNRCNTCHTVLTVHGNLRTDELKACVVCHNPNATDIPYRQYGDGPEVPINFEYLVHSIHRGSGRYTPFKVIGFGHTTYDFSSVNLQNPPVRNCEACHIPGAYYLPIAPGVQGTTVDTRSVLTSTQKTIDNDPSNNLRITPTAAVCSACHNNPTVQSHMLQYGAAFDVLQQSITSGAVKEQCVTCHGPGQSRDVYLAHNEPAPFPRLSSLSVNSGAVNTSIPVTIIGANLTGTTLQIAGTGVSASSIVIASTQISAVLNIAAAATLGPHVITVSGPAGTSEGLAFNVVPPLPVVNSVTPNSGAAGTSVAVVIRGTNLSGAALAASGTSVTISGVSGSASQINATLAIAASAAAGPVILTATTAGGASTGSIFNITAAAPADFTISAAPASLTVTAGSAAAYTVTVAASGGFGGSVGLTVSGKPAGLTSTYSPAAVTGSGSATLSLGTTGVLAGTYPLTINGTSGALTHAATVSLTILPVATGGSLTGATAAPAATVQLTNEGGLDWAHWGLNTAASFDHKATGGQQISNLTVVGSGATARYANNSTGFTWTDGTPTATASGSTTGVFISGQNNGFRITAPADTTPRTLRVYVGAWHTQARMTAHLSDSSSADYTDTSLTNTVSPTSLAVYTFTYRAASAGQTLTLTLTQELAGSGNVTLQAATLSSAGAGPDFSISATPSNQSVLAGGSAQFNVAAAGKNGFSGSVAFSLGGAPSGVTAAFNPATTTGSGSSVLTVKTTMEVPAGSYPLTVSGTSGSLVHIAGITLTVTQAAAGALSGSVSTPSGPVHLTAQGSLDWAHWGLAAASDFNHKATAAVQIGSFAVVGSAAVNRYANNSVGFTWTDGTPTASAINSTTGVFVNGQNNGFQLAVPADTSARTLKVYVGAWHTQGRLVAHLSDGSAADYVDTSLVNTVNPTGLAVYSLVFRAGSNGQTLTVTFTNMTANGNVTLQAATLAP